MNQEPEYSPSHRPPVPIRFPHELRRKAFHFATASIPIGYYFTDRITALIVVGILLAGAMIVEYARLSRSRINQVFHRFFGPMLRPDESSRYSAATFLLISSFLAIMAFHRDIAILTLLYLIIGDGLAAIIGRRYGRRKIFDKSLEGSLAFAGSCVLVSLFFPAVPFWIRLSGVFIATVSELVPMRASDNLRVPIISGSIMEILFISYLRQRSDMPSGDHLIVIVQAMGQFVLS